LINKDLLVSDLSKFVSVLLSKLFVVG